MRILGKVLLKYLIIGSTLIEIGCDKPTFSPISPTTSNQSSESTNHQTGTSPSTSTTTITSATNAPSISCGNPNDLLPDDSALQNCLDKGGDIRLEPGSPGYIINGPPGNPNRGLWLSRSGTVLTSSQDPKRATIIAGRDLFAHILRTAPSGGVNNFSIQYISFDGMVDEMWDGSPYRRMRDSCSDPENNSGNLVLQGNGFQFKNNESKNAMCGSGLGLMGNFDVQNNYIAYNGRDRFSGGGGVPWSDGMTVISCDKGYIGHNVLVDNTDIDLVVGGGGGCVVELNIIAHFGKYAFAGLNVGNFNNNGNHSGSEFRNNVIYSNISNRLSIGILVGSHPWTSKVDVVNAGKVTGNNSFGNVINLVVDGVYGGEITGNNIYNSQGSQGLGVCGESLNYTVYPPHVSNTILQTGWIAYQYDGDLSCGFYEGENRFRFGFLK